MKACVNTSTPNARAAMRPSCVRALCMLTSISAFAACTHGRCADDPTSKSEVVPKETGSMIDDRCPAALVAARKGGADPGRYVVPGDDDRDAIRRAMAELLGGTRDAAKAHAAAASFEIIDVAELPGVVLLRELPTQRRGGGAYLVRISSTSTLIVQAPHTFYDEGTLRLGCDFFQRAGARAFFIETAHRYKAAEKTEDGNDPADVAHQTTSLFQAATEGALNATTKATVLQLHGFATRSDGARLVLSNGTKDGGDPLVANAARALGAVLGGGVLRFPEDDHELGATTNAQGALVRSRGGRFLHVEMDARLRRELISDAGERARFLRALAEAIEAP